MRILLTGASGYIGRRALAELVRRGHDVCAVARQPPPDNRDGPDVRWRSCDLLAEGAAARLVGAERPEAILHFAWIATPGLYWTSPDNARWRRVTSELVSALADAGGQRFVGAGTCAEYDLTGGVPCDERQTPIAPATPYGLAKAGAWQDVARITSDATLSAAWGRIFYLFGGAEHSARLVPSVAQSLAAGAAALCTHGEQTRDFLHVDDVASAFVAILEGGATGPINIASGEPRRVREVVEGLAARLGRADLVRLGARPMNEPMWITARVDRLRDEVGWKPARSFEEGLNKAASRWRGEAVVNLNQ